MGKYPCLVLDHDDTLVQSESTVNYPAFLKALEVLRPGQTVSLRDFSLWTFQEGFTDMCVRHFGFTQSELDRQYEIWLDYVMTHTPPCFPEMAAVLRRQRELAVSFVWYPTPPVRTFFGITKPILAYVRTVFMVGSWVPSVASLPHTHWTRSCGLTA